MIRRIFILCMLLISAWLAEGAFQSTSPDIVCPAILHLASPAQAADDKAVDWGTIKGQLVFAGADVPKAKEINVDADKDHCLSKGPLLNEEWVINKENKGVRWVMVWLAPEPGGPKKLPIHADLQKITDKEVTVDQPRCAFEPHIVALRVGQNLMVKNSSPVAHNVNWTGHPLSNPGGNVIVPAKGGFAIKDLKAQKIPLSIACNIHKWMRGRVGVFDHPYFAVTDENGKFEIKQAPAGDYRLIVYHESVGWRGGAKGKDGEKVTIKKQADGVTDLGKLELKPSYDD